MKQGGVSWNSSPNSKRGIIGRYSCPICGRTYKQQWTMERHYKQCLEFEKAHPSDEE